ncbi:MAG: hypothetical protein EB015_04475 [Methylocystaceae bacterium]|nr:hypothetical protein [Methylocystaceae bacterium]
MGVRHYSHDVDGFMTDDIKKGPVPNPTAIVTVNNKGGSGVWVLGDDIGAPGKEYPDNPGVKSQLGAVKAGKNITIDADGTINSTGGGGSTDWSQITNKPATFTPPVATSTVVGGVKQGANITIGADGTISAQASSIVPATPTVLGGIKVGSGLNVTGDGTLSTQDAVPNWNDIINKPATFTPPIANASTLGGVKQGRGINIEVDGTINTESAAPEWNEIINKPVSFPPPVANVNTLGGVKQGQGVSIGPDGTISANIQQVDWDIIVDKPKAFPPTIASETEVGGVKAGNNISIDLDGTINAAAVDLPVANTYTLGGVKIGAGISVQEDGTIGTEAAAPYWLDIVDKPKAFPPTIAQSSIVGGIMPDDKFSVNESGVLSAKPFKGKSFQVVQYNDDGDIVGSPTLQNRNGNLILGGVAPTKAGEEITYGGQITLLDVSGAYQAGIRNDSFDYTLLLSNGPNIKKGFMPFVTQVENADVSLSFGPISDAIGYATKDKLGVVEIGNNIDVSSKGEISVKTATTEARGLVQVGQGLEVDANGVLSALNPIAFVNSKMDYNPDLKLAKSGMFEVPEGVDYFRVTLWGVGGKGGPSGGNAELWAGGGGGGGGAWYQFLVYAYKFETRKFSYALGAQIGNWSSYTGSTLFFDGEGNQLCNVGGGQNGQPGDSGNPVDWGFAQGGMGGYVAKFLPRDGRFAAERWASGGDGGTGFRIAQTKDSSKHKAIAGVGGVSGGGSGLNSTSRELQGFGGGAHGGGDNYPNGMVDAGYSAILIEW